MSALMSALASRRASRGDLRGGLRGFVVDKFGGALCVSGGGEHCSVVSSQDSQPGCDIGRMAVTAEAIFINGEIRQDDLQLSRN